MNKKEYLDSLEEIVQDQIFLTDSINELKKEIQVNHWSIGIDLAIAKSIKVKDFITFLKRVKQNRIKQLEQTQIGIDLLFYLWFDEQTGNLNFNFISSNHKSLPFNSDIEIVGEESFLVQRFLNTPYVDGYLMTSYRKLVQTALKRAKDRNSKLRFIVKF